MKRQSGSTAGLALLCLMVSACQVDHTHLAKKPTYLTAQELAEQAINQLDFALLTRQVEPDSLQGVDTRLMPLSQVKARCGIRLVEPGQSWPPYQSMSPDHQAFIATYNQIVFRACRNFAKDY